MTSIFIPVLGFMTTFLGVVYLLGCFTRVDSPRFIERTGGDPAKIHKLQSLQDAWSRLGKLRQFFASSAAMLFTGIALLAVWYQPALAGYFWVLPLVLLLNLGALLAVRKHAERVLDPDLAGHADVLKVIKVNLRMCVSFSIVFVILVVGT